MKLPKTVSLRSALTLSIILTVLVSSITYVIASSSSGTFTIVPGIYPGAPSYTIWTENSKYYCKDAYGSIPSWSYDATASAVIQASINALANGGKIFIKLGKYNIDTSIILANFITIEGEYNFGMGEGNGGTELILTDDVNMFTITGSGAFSGYRRHITLKNLRLDGNNKDATCINAKFAHTVTLSDLVIRDFQQSAIYAEACWEWIIRDCYISGNGKLDDPTNTAAIYLKNGDVTATNVNGFRIRGNTFGNMKSQAIYSDGTGASNIKYNNAIFITENWFHGYITSAERPDVDMIEGNFGELSLHGNNFVYSEKGFLKLLSSSSRIAIVGNEFSNAKDYMIYFDGTQYNSRTRIIGNYFGYHLLGETSDANANGIIYTANAYNIIADDNQARTNAVICPLAYGGVVDVSNYVLRLESTGVVYRSENSGTTVAIATGTEVNHGLVGTPTSITVTAAESGPTDIYVDTVGDTSFKINFGGSGNKIFYWYAEYHP